LWSWGRAKHDVLCSKPLLPEGRDEISPVFLQNFPRFFSKAKNSSKNHPNLHLKAFSFFSHLQFVKPVFSPNGEFP
jgi:hypothetical protein